MTHEASIALVGSVCSGVAAGIGFTMQAIGDMSFPWQEVSGFGVGGVAVFLVWFFMRRDEAVRQENKEATKAIAENFATTTKDITAKFAETTTTLTRESREDAAAREARLTTLFDKFHNDRP